MVGSGRPKGRTPYSQNHDWFEQSLDRLTAEGFRWENFQEIFPFGFLGIKEGDYVRLVNAALDALPNDKQRSVLLNLLDAQWCVYLEQLYIAQELGDDPQQFVGEAHFAFARLMIDGNIRWDRNLPKRDGSRAMLSLTKKETLMDRIMATGAESPDDDW